MRRHDGVVELPERVAFGEGLGVGDVDSSAGEAFAVERLDEGVHLVQAAAADGDEVRSALHPLELPGAHHLLALLRVWGGNEDHVGLGSTSSSWSGFTYFLMMGVNG